MGGLSLDVWLLIEWAVYATGVPLLKERGEYRRTGAAQ